MHILILTHLRRAAVTAILMSQEGDVGVRREDGAWVGGGGNVTQTVSINHNYIKPWRVWMAL